MEKEGYSENNKVGNIKKNVFLVFEIISKIK